MAYSTHIEIRNGKEKTVPNTSYSPHDFRDLLSGVLGRPEISVDKEKNIVKFLTSHAPQGIESSYENYVKNGHATKECYEILFGVYKQCLKFLLPPTVEKVEKLETDKKELLKTVEFKEAENEVMQQQQEAFESEVDQLKAQNALMAQQIATLTAMFQQLTANNQTTNNQTAKQPVQLIAPIIQ